MAKRSRVAMNEGRTTIMDGEGSIVVDGKSSTIVDGRGGIPIDGGGSTTINEACRTKEVESLCKWEFLWMKGSL
jgi:hypothetical protein